MSGAKELFYFAEDVAPKGLGEMFFFKVPREASTSADGENLFGSILERRREGFLHRHYWPVPMQFTEPQKYLKTLTQDESPNPVFVNEGLAGTVQHFDLNGGGGGHLAVSGIPGLPITLGGGLDLSQIRAMSFEYAGGQVSYIPRGISRREFLRKGGNGYLIDPTLPDNFVCDILLTSSQYTLGVTLSSKLSAEAEASLATEVAGVNGSLKLDYSRSTDESFKIALSGDKRYVVALGVSRWDEFGD